MINREYSEIMDAAARAASRREAKDSKMQELAKRILPDVNGQGETFADPDDCYTLCCLVLGIDPHGEHYVDENGDVT